MMIESRGATSGRVSSLSENNSNEPKENTKVYLVFCQEDFEHREILVVLATEQLVKDWFAARENPDDYTVETWDVISVLPDR